MMIFCMKETALHTLPCVKKIFLTNSVSAMARTTGLIGAKLCQLCWSLYHRHFINIKNLNLSIKSKFYENITPDIYPKQRCSACRNCPFVENSICRFYSFRNYWDSTLFG